MRPAAARSRLASSFFALAAIALFLPSLVARHAAGEPLSHERAHDPVVVELAAAHATAPAHLEAPDGSRTEHCLACTLASRKASAPGPEARLAAQSAARPAPGVAPVAPPRRLDLPLPPGRSPPAC